ncbi:MAG: YARHG domain-containing protein [Kofleriaceae bacterium]
MNLPRVVVSVAVATAVGVPAVARADKSAPVRDAYLALRDGGCDVTSIGSPVVARVLRNVPYALQGKIFKSPELAYVFDHDGGWYQGTDAKADVTAADRACVRALDKQEQAMRKRGKLPAALEAAVTRSGESVIDMMQVPPGEYRKLAAAQRVNDGQRIWTLSFMEGKRLVFLVHCAMPEAQAKTKAPDWSTLECHTLAPG